MKVLNKLKIQRSCVGCELCNKDFFCNLPPSELQVFESLKITNVYPKGTMLFMEGQPADGIYMICQGRIKLSSCSSDGKIIILRIAGAGEILGLSGVVSDSYYKATAEAVESCQVNFVRKSDFLNLIRRNSEICLSAAKQLSHNYHTAHLQICSLGLSASVSDKLAKLFLAWCETNSKESSNIHLKMIYTQEEMAEMIGTARETVSRVLKDFKDRKLITIKGSDLIIHDKRRLEAAISSR